MIRLDICVLTTAEYVGMIAQNLGQFKNMREIVLDIV